MNSNPAAGDKPVNPQKHRKGLSRLWHATIYSIQGLRAAWTEGAFRQESYASVILLPLSLWLGNNWVETALLAGSVLLLLVVELLNTAIETGKSIPTELVNESRKLHHESELDLRTTGGDSADIDDEYANIGIREPKVCITTSRDPSSRLKQFAKLVLRFAE